MTYSLIWDAPPRKPESQKSNDRREEFQGIKAGRKSELVDENRDSVRDGVVLRDSCGGSAGGLAMDNCVRRFGRRTRKRRHSFGCCAKTVTKADVGKGFNKTMSEL